jgi:hypothetical protein
MLASMQQSHNGGGVGDEGMNVSPDGRTTGFAPIKMPRISHPWFGMYSQERRASHRPLLVPLASHDQSPAGTVVVSNLQPCDLGTA